MVGVRRVGLGCGGLGTGRLAVGDADHAGLAVQLEKHPDLAIVLRVADGDQPDLKRLAGIDLGGDLFFGRHAVKEGEGRQGPHRAISRVAHGVVGKDLGIHQVAVQILVVDCRAVECRADLGARLFQIDRGQVLAGAFGVGCFTLQNLTHDGLGEPARRLAEIAAHHVDHTVGEGDILVRVLDIRTGQVLRNHHQRHVPDDLRRGSNLDDIAEHLVHVGIGLRDLVPAFLKTHGARLRLEVGELAAGHLVQIDLRGGGLHAGFERGVLAAHGLPVVRDFAHGGNVDAAGAWAMFQRLKDRPEGRLRGVPRECIHRRIHHVHPGRRSRENGRDRRAGGVMSMEMDWQIDRILQRREQHFGHGRGHHSGHVLDPQDMRAGGLQLLRHIDVIGDVVFRARRVQRVAGVTDRALANLARGLHRVHRHPHVLDPVEGIKHAEHVHPGLGGLADELLHDVVGIVGVSDAVGGAQQHLRQDIGHLGADVAQTLPRAFLQEAVGHVKRRPAPAFHRKQPTEVGGVGGRDLGHVDRPHPGGEQGLMPVAHGRVGEQQFLLLQHPLGDGLGALVHQQVAAAVGRRLPGEDGHARRFEVGMGQGAPLHLWMTVDRDIGDIGQHLGAAILTRGKIEEGGRRVDELGGVFIAEEGRVFQQVLDKGDIGADATDTEFAQGAVHPLDRLFGGRGPGGDLDQQAVVIARDDPAGISRAAVQTNAHARRGPVGRDAPVIGDEVVLRIFGGDPGLQRMPVQANIALTRLSGRLRQWLALGDQNLRLHDVDAGDLFGDCVFDLHAGVDLDEVELAVVHIHQEFDGAGAFVIHMGADFAAQFADLRALLIAEIGGRRALHHLLVAALDRAVALE